MKPIKIHPVSALAGIGILALALVAISAAQSIKLLPGEASLVKILGDVDVRGIPSHDQLVRIKDTERHRDHSAAVTPDPVRPCRPVSRDVAVFAAMCRACATRSSRVRAPSSSPP